MEDKNKLLQELKLKGHEFNSIHDLFKQYALDDQVVEVILQYLPFIYKESLGSGDQLVRSLFSAKAAFNPEVLIDLFENSAYNEQIKSSIGLVLAKAKTFNISDWIKDQLLSKPYAFERAALMDGLECKSGISTPESLVDFLKLIYDKYWWFESYQKMYKKYAQKEDILFLEEKIDHTNKRMVKEISKVIEGIRLRKKSYKTLK